MPNQIVDFNLPNAYQAEMDKIAYQQRLAEMLQEQSQQPIGEYSYKGIQARIPATAGLAKVLQAFGAAYNQKKAEEQKTELQKQQLEDYRNDYAMAREARMGVAGTDAVPSSGMIPAVAGSPEVRVGDETVMGMAPSSAAQQYKPAVQATPEKEPYGMAPSTFAKDAVAAVAPNPQEYERILQMSKNPFLNQMGFASEQNRLEREQAANIKEGDRQTQIKRIIASYGTNPPPLANGMTLLQSLAIDPSGKLYVDQIGKDLERKFTQAEDDRKFNSLSEFQRKSLIAAAEKRNKDRLVYDSNRGGMVNLDTGKFYPVTSDGVAIGAKPTTAAAKELLSIQQSRSTINGAINAVIATPTAFSFKRGLATDAGTTTESIAGRYDTPEETAARAYVFNNVSAVIKERAGTAQSAQELTRINSFLPGTKDDDTQILNKLRGYSKYLDDLEAGTLGNPTTITPDKKIQPISGEADAPGLSAAEESELQQLRKRFVPTEGNNK